MDLVVINLVKVLIVALNFFQFVVIANVVMSWLVAFNIINTSNKFVYMIMDFTHRLTEPLYRRLRNVLPDLGGLDLSPIIVLLGIFFVQGILRDVLYRL
ncbi:MAG: YggT family protein [Magnetovibrio sp.]|nr:YggT family protein [Magnetovibrio sp.]